VPGLRTAATTKSLFGLSRESMPRLERRMVAGLTLGCLSSGRNMGRCEHVCKAAPLIGGGVEALPNWEVVQISALPILEGSRVWSTTGSISPTMSVMTESVGLCDYETAKSLKHCDGPRGWTLVSWREIFVTTTSGAYLFTEHHK
jgi:hypothetical protein